MRLNRILLLLTAAVMLACGDDQEEVPNTGGPDAGNESNLTIFFVNDQHGRIDNFSRLKVVVDDAKENGDVLLVSAGDIFAGNPIVDQFAEPGFPMIDIMNEVGFDVGVLGNHEFDFGTDVLAERIDQSNFPWVLANVDASGSVIDQPDPFVTLSVGDLRVTFVGVVETNGKEDDVIPSTHPLRVADLSFQRYDEVLPDFADLKSEEDADILVALTHLGSNADRALANSFPFFDLIIGGHSHERINETINGVPIVQAGANLEALGRIDLVIADQTVTNYQVSLINLASVTGADEEVTATIASYNDDPSFSTVVGQSDFNHQSLDVGCFFTTALREYMEVDFTIQNLGGIRAGIDQGPITRFEIFTMDPFNNRSVAYTKTVGEFERFFCETGSRFVFTGIEVNDTGSDFQIIGDDGAPLPDDQLLTLGVNDYIPAVYDGFFDVADADIRGYTTAEAIIGYLQEINSTIDFEGCERLLQCD